MNLLPRLPPTFTISVLDGSAILSNIGQFQFAKVQSCKAFRQIMTSWSLGPELPIRLSVDSLEMLFPHHSEQRLVRQSSTTLRM